MNETEHRKRMLIQQIADHRDLMRLEMDALRDANPVLTAIDRGRRLIGTLGAIRSGRLEGASAPLNVALVTTVLPAALQVLRALAHRRHAKRASEQHA